MLIYFHNINKVIYIMAPKCGTTTIANLVKANFFTSYNKQAMSNLNNPEYKKIIIIRKSVIDRFLSGFYEDLFNNTCYDNMNITFNEYLKFLDLCYTKKIKNVTNMKMYNGIRLPLWYGNCSGLSRPITDSTGNFCSHLISQKHAISHITKMITCKNVNVVDLSNLQDILPVGTPKHNVKNKIEDLSINFSEMTLSYIKSNRIIVSSLHLNESQQKLILDMYTNDLLFIEELITRFN